MINNYFEYFAQIKEPLLTGTNILLTGSGQYSSRDIVKVLEQEGAKVVHWTDDDCDFSSEVLVGGKLKDLLAEMTSLDVLITNFFRGDTHNCFELTSADLQQLWESNVKRTFCVCSQTAPYFAEKRAGKIINILSASGKRSFMGANAAECSSASAVIGLTKGYAEYLAPYQVTANCVAAGLIKGSEPSLDGKTLAEVQNSLPMKWQPIQKFGTTKDIGCAAAFLASRLAGYITGYTMDVNGGFYMD